MNTIVTKQVTRKFTKFFYDNEKDIIDSVDTFLKKIKAERINSEKLKEGTTWYFRGDKLNEKLIPSIGKLQQYCGLEYTLTLEDEKRIFHRFRRFAYKHLGGITNEWEAMFLARHYDLPTRILDWTSNPLHALYFSCSPRKEKKEKGVVWGILRIKDEDSDLDIFKDENKNPLRLYYEGDKQERAIKLIYPVYNSDRLIAQKGIFTWHSHPKIPLDRLAGEPFNEDNLDIIKLVRWKINTKNRLEIIRDLEGLGISQRYIFPDLGGIAEGLKNTIVLWNGS